MDQIRTIFGVLWRERFWVLTVLGTIFAIVCWYLSAGSLDKQFATRKTKINGTFTSMQSLSNEPDHPNPNVIEGNKDQALIERDQVLKTWQDLYNEQKEEVLKWPEKSLEKDFIEEIRKLKFQDPFPSNKEMDMRDDYANYIGTRLDALLEIVKARKIEGTGNRGERGGMPFNFDLGEETFGRGGRGRDEDEVEVEELDYIVEWLDQGNLRGKLDFEGRKPTSLQIWVTQEDLWVYETLLNVIRKTNQARGSTRPDNAAVQVIFRLEVGSEAAEASKESPEIFMPVASDGFGGPGREFEPGVPGRGMGPPGFRGGDFGEETYDNEVLAGRYLQADGEPFPEAPTDPEFRRLPIHMTLTMDLRWLPKLLVECANAALPVEVTQVMVNPDKAASGSSDTRGAGGRKRTEFEGGVRTQTSGPTTNPNMVEVVIDGIVYIYNEPNKEVLALPGLEETGEAGDQLAGTDGNP